MIAKKIYVENLKDGLVFDDFFIIKFKKPILKYSKGYRFELRVGDKSGEIMLKFWGGEDLKKVEDIFNSFKKNDVIYINKIKVSKYHERLELNINEDSEIKVISDYDCSAIIACTTKDMDLMVEELKSYIDKVEDVDYSRILNSIFTNELINSFSKAPAAMYLHHGYIGGLLEHTLNVCKYSLKIAQDYEDLDKDLIVTGALLHDIGKLEELEVNTNINTTIKGHLLGHISLGAMQINKVLEKLEIEDNKKIKLLNIILSHHGLEEYGSPKKPGTPEALLISLADNLDAKLKRIIDIRKNAKTEDDFIYNKEFGNIFLK